MKRLLLIVFVIFSVSACEEKPVMIEVYLSANTTVLNPGESIQINATILPEKAANTQLIWKSSDNSILSVNNGTVKALAPGSATVSVCTLSQPTISEMNFRVRTPVSSLRFENDTTSVVEGFSEQLSVSISPSNADNTDLSWSTSDESIATVSNEGVVSGLSPGSVTITATAIQWDKSINCIVSVLSVKPRTLTYTTIDGEMYPEWFTTMGDNPLLRHEKRENGGAFIYKNEIKRLLSPFGRSNPKLVKTISLPDGVESIEQGTFMRFENLESVNFPNTLKTIEQSAFEGTAIHEAYLPDSVSSIGVNCFYYCKHLESIIIGNGIESIPYAAFADCDNIKYLEFGSKVVNIEDYSFTLSKYIPTRLIDTIYFHSSTPPSLSHRMIELPFACGNFNKTTIFIPKGSKDSYIQAGWNTYKEMIEY